MSKVEPIQEYLDAKALKERMARLPVYYRTMLTQEIADQVSWHGPVTKEWLENELASYERMERHG